ncbi:MAG TPA: flagellar basal body rod protein FlgB [Myxococcaceae bacterium]|nr:flagellar basal body rod protein FlgB [Myxococcaceae bacterium]
MKLFDATLSTLEKALDVRLVRQNVLASNLANANTPGFQPQDVDFARSLEAVQAQSTAGEGSLPAEQAVVTVPMPGASPGLDGNGVDADRTMVALAQNALQYGAAARAAGKKLAILRYVVTDGNG